MISGKRLLLPKTLLSTIVFLRRRLGGSLAPHRRSSPIQRSSSRQEAADGGLRRAVVCGVEDGLLRSSSTFPYFMLVALERGSLLRAIILLLVYPILCLIAEETAQKVMAMVCFWGVKEGQSIREGRAVLPKHLLDGVGLEGFRRLTSGGGTKVCVTGMPRVMVEATLKEYLGVDVVLARDLAVAAGGQRYTGFMDDRSADGVLGELLGGRDDGVLWVGGVEGYHRLRQPFVSANVDLQPVPSEWRRQPLPRDRYAKPLVFHDGRIAFRPTWTATLAMFLWLPFGLLLALLRAAALFWLPYRLSIPFLAAAGMTNRLVGAPFFAAATADGPASFRMFACNHRTLLDPLYVSGTLGKPVTAVTYSLSRVSEVLSPIRTVRLSRKKEDDGRKMAEELSKGHLVVCPEGTTCREPYLLRFSPLFAEVAPEAVVPVALDSGASMFYGTTAGGRKWMDPLFFAMDPFPRYAVEFLEEVPVFEADGARRRRSKYDVANQVQRQLAEALGFRCTMLNRKDKYLMLAGNEGFVNGTG